MPNCSIEFPPYFCSPAEDGGDRQEINHRFCKPMVGGSNPSPGTMASQHFPCFLLRQPEAQGVIYHDDDVCTQPGGDPFRCTRGDSDPRPGTVSFRDADARTALDRTLLHALQQVGFYFIVNHRVPQSLIDATFTAAQQFHAQSRAREVGPADQPAQRWLSPFKGSTIRHSQLNRNNRPDLNEAFFVKRDLPPDHPDVVAGKVFRSTNQWPPPALPGFRATVNAYYAAMEGLARSLLPLYAEALELPSTWFDSLFNDPMCTLLMSHYPKQDAQNANEFGIAPHSDTGFMTLLAHNRVPGFRSDCRAACGSMRRRCRAAFCSMAATCCAAGAMTAASRHRIG